MPCSQHFLLVYYTYVDFAILELKSVKNPRLECYNNNNIAGIFLKGYYKAILLYEWTLKVRVFQKKNSSNHIFDFLVNFFNLVWRFLIVRPSWVNNQSEVSKFTKKIAKIWFDENFLKIPHLYTTIYKSTKHKMAQTSAAAMQWFERAEVLS